MMPVSTKLTLLISLFPIVTSTIFGVVLYRYRATLEASDVLNSLSTLLTAILVVLLVWERLRESLSKKLDYLHKDYLNLYNAYRPPYIFSRNQDNVSKAKDNLKRYGRFWGISLYPSCLINKIDKSLNSFRKKDESISEIYNIGKKLFASQFDPDLWYHLLDIIPLGNKTLQSHKEKSIFKQYEEKAKKVRIEQAKLIEEFKSSHKEFENTKKEIIEKLEDFLKSNNLSLT